MLIENKFKKNLLITLEYPPFRGGVAKYYKNLVDFLGIKVEVISSSLIWLGWPKWLPGLWQVGMRIKKGDIKNLLIGQVLPLGYVGLFFKFLIGLPFIVFCHGLDVLIPQQSVWKKRWLVKVLQGAQKIVANSDFTKEEIVRLGIEKEKIIVIYPCVSQIPVLSQAEKKELIILSVGRIIARKGFDQVIESLPEIIKSQPTVKYVLIGQGEDLPRLKQLAKDRGVEKQVLFLENINDTALADWYEQASVFVMPCRQTGPDVEGLGTVFLEAAVFGLPIIVGNSGGAKEAMLHEKTGLLVNPNSLSEITQALLVILNDKEKAEKMGQAGQQMVREKFTCQLQLEKINKLID